MLVDGTGESKQNLFPLRVGGIVLCGGQSRRMGRPKAWLPFGNELMLPRIVRLLREAMEPVVVVAAPDQDVPALPSEVQIVRDEEKGRGPLQGLLAGIKALSERADAVYASSCDAPFVRPAFVRRMIELLGQNAICVPHVDDYQHPLAAVYRVGVRDVIVRYSERIVCVPCICLKKCRPVLLKRRN